MDTPYDLRERLRAALHPAMAEEHKVVDWLCQQSEPRITTIIEMVERRRRTDRRSARMAVAQLAIEFFEPRAGSPADIAARMEHIAEGGDDIDLA